jgi:propionate CoA-transferase
MEDSKTARERLGVLSRHLAIAFAPRPPTHLAAGGRQTLTTQPCKSTNNDVLNSQLSSADEAVKLISDGQWMTVQGFVGTGIPEALTTALRRRFDSTGHPRGLSLLMVASVGDGKGRGMDRLAVEGLLEQVIYGWAGNCPSFAQLIRMNKIKAYNIPLGVVSHMIREVAAGRKGPITHVGLGTFVDPRHGGGKLNSATTDDIVFRISLPDTPSAQEKTSQSTTDLLWYKAPKAIHVALLRGTTADVEGNVSFEKEALFGDALAQAMAARNSGGVVIVQVERLADKGTIPTRSVHLPGCLVDKIVVVPPGDAAVHHAQTFFPGVPYDPSLSGQVRVPTNLIPALKLDPRRIIAHRAMLEIDRPNMVVNLGVGMPEGVGAMVAALGSTLPGPASVTLSTEAGVFGGIPCGGPRFGTAHNPVAHIPTNSMIDFYNGGGADLACLGMAEVGEDGSVNVHYFKGRMPGCGGFIDISQNAKKVCFLGTMTSGGLEISVDNGRMKIVREGRARKFVKSVLQKTFAASSTKRPIIYITERAVFQLVDFHSASTGTGLELIEIAPGIDVERDILSLMDFVPLVPPKGPRIMDSSIFQP